MTRTTINPRCPYCKVRHSLSKTWRCEERDKSDDPEQGESEAQG